MKARERERESFHVLSNIPCILSAKNTILSVACYICLQVFQRMKGIYQYQHRIMQAR